MLENIQCMLPPHVPLKKVPLVILVPDEVGEVEDRERDELGVQHDILEMFLEEESVAHPDLPEGFRPTHLYSYKNKIRV